MKQNTEDLEIALDEMRLNIKQSLEAGDALDRKLNQVMLSSGAILSVTATLQLTIDWSKSNLYWIFFYYVIECELIFWSLTYGLPGRTSGRF